MMRLHIGVGVVLLAVFAALLSVRTQPVPEFTPFITGEDIYVRGLAAAGDIAPEHGIVAVLVNHHLLAADLIARALARTASAGPMTVVLVAPDHFGVGAAPVTTVVGRWKTPFGILEPAEDAVMAVSGPGLANRQELPFVREHGITNITPFIARLMPDARLVPIIFRDGVSDGRVDAVARAVADLPGRVVVVGSLDFSHDATAARAEENDRTTARILADGNPDAVAGAAVDSRPALRFLLQYARVRGATFRLLERSDSSTVLGQPWRTDVTSYITGVWEAVSTVVQ